MLEGAASESQESFVTCALGFLKVGLDLNGEGDQGRQGLKSGAARSRSSAHMRCWCCKLKVSMLCHHISLWNLMLLGQKLLVYSGERT